MDLENVGPLTTLFVPPPSCTSDFLYLQARPTEVIHNGAKADCYPVELTRGATIYPLEEVYFSPGLCPSGWQSERGDAVVTRLVENGQMKLEEGEYAGICCPSNYDVAWQSISGSTLTASCVSDLVGPVNASACAGCEYFTEVPVRMEDGQWVTAVETTLMVRWKASDFEARPQYSTSYGPFTSGRLLPSETGGTRSEGSDLSTPQKVGIGVGVAAGIALAALIFGFFLFVRRRRSSRRMGGFYGGPEELSGETVTKVELPTDTAAAELNGADVQSHQELKGDDLQSRHEIEEAPVWGPPRNVLSANTAPVELDATPRELGTYRSKANDSRPQELRLDTSSEAARMSSETRPMEVSPLDSPTGIDLARQTHRPLKNEISTQEEEGRRQKAYQETKRLLEEDKRLRAEQEMVRRRLAELQRQQGEIDTVRTELSLDD
ncbi:hypothetical protein V8F20_008597 [Naviculisporaceae sp. PSN 640]